LSAASRLQIIPLGGLGEFGMNLTVFRHGDDCLIVDAGIMFPREPSYGVDLLIPDLSFLDGCGTLHGVVLTHGHEDHIGAIPYLLARHDLPVYGAPFTLALCRARLAEHPRIRSPRLEAFPTTGEPLRLGPFTVEALPTAHSIPQTRILAIRTPAGTLLHTADFKLDPDPPGGEAIDLKRLRSLGDQGVLALLSDSTNAPEPGTTPPEAQAIRGISEQLASARGRVLVTTFSSNVHRVQALAELALRHGRRLAVVGSSLRSTLEIAEQQAVVRFPQGVRIAPQNVMDLDPCQALIVGSMINELLETGVSVVTGREAPVHVSGHPSQQELLTVLELVRPRYLIPIHGEYRQLRAHARLAVDAGMPTERVLLANSGDRIVVGEGSIELGDPVTAGQVPIDANLQSIDRTLLDERRKIAAEGLVIAVLTVDATGAPIGRPEIVTRGFHANGIGLSAIEQQVVESIADCSAEERTDPDLLQRRISNDLTRFLRRCCRRQPLICPIIKEQTP